MVKVAAAILAAAGAFTLMTRFQITGVRIRPGVPAEHLPTIMLVLGPLALVLGILIQKARTWAAVAGVVVGLLLTLSMGYWLYFSFSHRFYSLMSGLAVLTSATTLVAVPLAVPACVRAQRARAKLRAEGIELGF